MANANLKMCPACRGLIAAGDTVCSLCGAEARAGRQRSGAVETPMTVTVTGVIFTVNLVFYALSLLLSTKLSSGGAGGFSLEPDGDALALLGADYGSAVRAGEYWRVLTYAFLHGGVLHILMNSLALIQVGRLAEEVYGGAKYFCLYLFAALTGGIVIALTNNAAVGASGAVFGLIGAMAVYGYKRGDTFGHALKADMVQWLIYGAIISLSPRISFAGHLGGLIGGAGMAWFLDDQEQTLASQRRTGVWKSAAALGLVLTVAAFAMIGLRMRGELAGLQTEQQARMRQGGQRQLTDTFIFWRRNLRAAMAAMALTPGTGAE
ncbi:MAG: rhomboid family intramembrane serine protease, partial [Blastocatellia bacterium]